MRGDSADVASKCSADTAHWGGMMDGVRLCECKREMERDKERGVCVNFSCTRAIEPDVEMKER